MNELAQTITPERSLQDLSAEYLGLHAQKKELEREMNFLKELIIARTGTKEDGQITEKTDLYKLTVKSGVRRTVDTRALLLAKAELTKEFGDRADGIFSSIFEFKPALRTTPWKGLREGNPAAHSILAAAVTSKPQNPSLSIEELEA